MSKNKKNKNQLIILLIMIFAIFFFMRSCSNDEEKKPKIIKYYLTNERLVVKPTPWDRYHSHQQLRECTYENGVKIDQHHTSDCAAYLLDTK